MDIINPMLARKFPSSLSKYSQKLRNKLLLFSRNIPTLLFETATGYVVVDKDDIRSISKNGDHSILCTFSGRKHTILYNMDSLYERFSDYPDFLLTEAGQLIHRMDLKSIGGSMKMIMLRDGSEYCVARHDVAHVV